MYLNTLECSLHRLSDPKFLLQKQEFWVMQFTIRKALGQMNCCGFPPAAGSTLTPIFPAFPGAAAPQFFCQQLESKTRGEWRPWPKTKLHE